MNCFLSSAVCIAFFLCGNVVSAERYYRDRLADDCVPRVKFEKDFSFFPEPYKIEGALDGGGVEITVADDFRVTYGENFKFVENLRVNESYLLYQCGTSVPDLEEFPDDVKVFEIPLSSVALNDVTSSSFFAELDVTDRVKYVSPYATNACLQKISHGCRRLASNPQGFEVDEIALRKQNRRTDALFLFSATNHSESIAFTATMDPAVLNRAEWVKFVALFFNKEPEANAFFNNVLSTWEKYKMEGTKKKGPTIAWLSYQDYDGKEYFIHQAAYKNEYIKAVGGITLSTRYIKSSDQTVPTRNGFLIEFEKRRIGATALHKLLRDVDIVVDETYQQNNTAYKMKDFLKTYHLKAEDDFPFLKKKMVFRLDGLIGKTPSETDTLDWYETAVARPDLVLIDMQKAFGIRRHAKHQRMWIRNIAKGELPQIITRTDCTTFESCYAIPQPICPAVEVTCDGDILYRNITSPCQQIICN